MSKTAARQICIGCGGAAYGFHVQNTDKFVCSSPCFAQYRECNASLYSPVPATATATAVTVTTAAATTRPKTLGAPMTQTRRTELPATPVRAASVAAAVTSKPAAQLPTITDDPSEDPNTLFVIVPSANATAADASAEKERRPRRVDSVELLDEDDIFGEPAEQ
jgi:hypothetical protein